MGKAQKLKQQKKLAEQRAAEEKLHKRQARFRVVAIVLIILVTGGTVAGLLIGLWPASYKYQELVLDTSKGEIRIELLADAAPNTVNRISQLVDEGFYTDQRFHRVLDSIAQVGDPQSKNPNVDLSSIGDKGSGKTFANEINPQAAGFGDDVNNYWQDKGLDVGQAAIQMLMAATGGTQEQILSSLGTTMDQITSAFVSRGYDYNQASATAIGWALYPYQANLPSAVMGDGTVAMANSGPGQPAVDSSGQPQTDENGKVIMQQDGSNDSQFFIIRKYDVNDPSMLSWRYKHTVFGRVVSGMDVVNQIVQGDTINKAYIWSQTRHR